MDKQFAMQWAKELRSGKYKQGKTYLQAEGKFCCLGVACELVDKLKLIPIKKSVRNDIISPDFKTKKVIVYNRYASTLAEPIMTAIRMNSSSPGVLAELNDIKKWSFDQIADYIEENYERL